MDKFYKPNLANIHHKYFSDLAINAAQELLNHISEKDLHSKTVVDLGCGSGTLASVLSEKGLSVIGVDISEDMLNIAKATAPKAEFFHASIFDFEIPHCHFITAIGEPINYLFDGKSNYETIRTLVNNIYIRLNRGGNFLFDVLTNEVSKEPTCKKFEKDDVTMVVEINVDQFSDILERKMTIFSKQGACYKKDKEVHRQFLVDKTKVSGILEECGFTVSNIDNYNGFTFRQGHTGYICKKPN